MIKNNQQVDLIEFARSLQGAQDKGLGTTEGGQEAIRTIHTVQAEGQSMGIINPTLISGSEAKIIVMVIDDSGSMSPRASDVVSSINDVLDALEKASRRDQIVVVIDYLNRGLIVQPTRRSEVRRFTGADYVAQGGTPLFDGAQTALASVYAQTAAFVASGKTVTIHAVIVTDGGECSSTFATAESVKKLIGDLRGQNSPGLAGFAILGIDIGGSSSATLLAMGLDQTEIEPVGTSQKQLRARLQLWSKTLDDGSGLGNEVTGI